MFERVIEFTAPKIYTDQAKLRGGLPKPIKLNIPEWYKKLEHNLKNSTAKGCMPFLDTLSFRYVLSLPVDIKIKHNILKENKETGKKQRDSEYEFPLKASLGEIGVNLNTMSDPSFHPPKQLEGSPLIERNKHLPFYKVFNPWTIKTPPGYSCLFVPPLNNTDDRFGILPGIVDTDLYPNEINFPFCINGDKYPNLDTMLKRGTPYVQIIPFKRDNWKMKISTKTTQDFRDAQPIWPLSIIHNYKLDIWNKKRCD